MVQKGIIATLLERTRQHFAQVKQSTPSVEYHGDERREDVRPRADSRLYRARFGFPGSYRVYTKDGHKAIFNIWVSQDGTVRLLHPRVCWKKVPNGEYVELLRFDDKGPHLPEMVLSGIAADVARFPEEYRDDLAEFQLILLAAVREYDDQLRHKGKDAVPPASP